MNWKLKALIQNMIAHLPRTASYATYYWLQRHFSELKRTDPIDHLMVAVEICRIIEKLGKSPVGKTFLEVGTGRTILLPLGFWLAGAERIITVDLNPYLKEELVKFDIDYIGKNHVVIEQLFDGRLDNKRFADLVTFVSRAWRLKDVLAFLNVEYVAPADASRLLIPSKSIDFHASNTVFEHIPAKTILAILEEGNRVVKADGLFIHRIDLSDHFSHSDKSISKINFLQYSDNEWDRISGNRYSYMNRLRLDDLVDLFERANQKVLINKPDIDSSLYQILKAKKFKVSSKFSGKSDEILAMTGAWLVSSICN